MHSESEDLIKTFLAKVENAKHSGELILYAKEVLGDFEKTHREIYQLNNDEGKDEKGVEKFTQVKYSEQLEYYKKQFKNAILLHYLIYRHETLQQLYGLPTDLKGKSSCRKIGQFRGEFSTDYILFKATDPTQKLREYLEYMNTLVSKGNPYKKALDSTLKNTQIVAYFTISLGFLSWVLLAFILFQPGIITMEVWLIITGAHFASMLLLPLLYSLIMSEPILDHWDAERKVFSKLAGDRQFELTGDSFLDVDKSLTRCSIFKNQSPTISYSKKQSDLDKELLGIPKNQKPGA